MTDPMELVGRLDELRVILCAQKKHAEIKNGDGNSSDWEPSDWVCGIPKEAADCIREMVEEKAAMQARLDRWEPKLVSPGSVSVSCAVGGNNSPLPPRTRSRSMSADKPLRATMEARK